MRASVLYLLYRCRPRGRTTVERGGAGQCGGGQTSAGGQGAGSGQGKQPLSILTSAAVAAGLRQDPVQHEEALVHLRHADPFLRHPSEASPPRQADRPCTSQPLQTKPAKSELHRQHPERLRRGACNLSQRLVVCTALQVPKRFDQPIDRQAAAYENSVIILDRDHRVYFLDK